MEDEGSDLSSSGELEELDSDCGEMEGPRHGPKRGTRVSEQIVDDTSAVVLAQRIAEARRTGDLGESEEESSEESGGEEGEEAPRARSLKGAGGFWLRRSVAARLFAHQREAVLWMWSLHEQGCGGIVRAGQRLTLEKKKKGASWTLGPFGVWRVALLETECTRALSTRECVYDLRRVLGQSHGGRVLEYARTLEIVYPNRGIRGKVPEIQIEVSGGQVGDEMGLGKTAQVSRPAPRDSRFGKMMVGFSTRERDLRKTRV